MAAGSQSWWCHSCNRWCKGQCPILPELRCWQRQLYSSARCTPALAGHRISGLGLAVETGRRRALGRDHNIPEIAATRRQRRQRRQDRQDEGQAGRQRTGTYSDTWSVSGSTDLVFACSTFSTRTGYASDQCCAIPRGGDGFAKQRTDFAAGAGIACGQSGEHTCGDISSSWGLPGRRTPSYGESPPQARCRSSKRHVEDYRRPGPIVRPSMGPGRLI